MVEDRSAVLRAPVRALAIQLGGIVVLPKNVQQLIVGNLAGIVIYFHRFGMAGAVGADLFVSGVFSFPADVAYAGGGDAGKLAEGSFDFPETAGGKCSFGHG